ncbi:hypothetical protein [Pseudomonas sp.]|uniref:hypothetical protein n=1 Tax=Pseudomonas sp. TaxID=306 RepID=UPI003FD73283
MLQDIKVIATDPIEFFKVSQEAIIRGARIKGNTFVSLKTIPLMVELTVDVQDPDSQWVDKGPNIWATPIPAKVYTKEELDGLEWVAFKQVFNTATGETGRDRVLMSRKYLEVTNQQSKE